MAPTSAAPHFVQDLAPGRFSARHAGQIHQSADPAAGEASVAMDAAARQLPVIGEGGKLMPFSVPEVRSDEAIAQAAVDDALHKQRIWVTCRKCTREEVFHGKTKYDAVMALRQAGWTYDEIKGDGREICPDCPAVRVV